MGLREELTAAVKTSMLARNAERTSSLRMIQAKLKDTDIAARPKGIDAIPDDEIAGYENIMEAVEVRDREKVTKDLRRRSAAN